MPENYNLNPAPANAKVALILVDTATTRFTGDLALTQQRWMDAATKMGACYAETSYNSTQVTPEWIQKVSLPEPGAHYTANIGTNKFLPTILEEATATALGAGFDFQRYWALILIIEPFVDASGILQTVWADAANPTGTPAGTPTQLMIGNKLVSYRPVSISRDQGEAANSIPAHQVLFHEMGHTFGLYDLYAPFVQTNGKIRNMICWDPMHEEDQDPGFSLVNKLRMGWIQPASVPTFDLRVVPHLPGNFTLTPLELPPSAIGSMGVELRLADGWDYYLEYRSQQNTQILDQEGWDWSTGELHVTQRVLLTDAVVNTWPIPITLTRPDLMLALDDSPNPRLGLMHVGSKYTEGSLPLDLEVISMDATKAVIKMAGGNSAGPDPSIRPWNPPQSWQSPDIEVTNDKTTADPARYANLPHAGWDNTIVAYISNNGTMDANGVVVDFYVCDYGANGPLMKIGSANGDVPIGARIPFSISGWVPPVSAATDGHWCVVARIQPYTTTAGLKELSSLNNEARSNYTQFISFTASPAARVGTTFAVRNPYNADTIAFLGTSQDNPSYVTYIEHRWVRLAPGELRHVRIGFEYLPESDHGNNEPCHVNIAASIVDPQAGNVRTLGGATIRVLTGRATQLERVVRTSTSLRGRVVAVDNGKPVNGGTILVGKAAPLEDRQIRGVSRRVTAPTVLKTVGQVRVKRDGTFTLPMKVKGRLRLEYLGVTGFDDCVISV